MYAVYPKKPDSAIKTAWLIWRGKLAMFMWKQKSKLPWIRIRDMQWLLQELVDKQIVLNAKMDHLIDPEYYKWRPHEGGE